MEGGGRPDFEFVAHYWVTVGAGRNDLDDPGDRRLLKAFSGQREEIEGRLSSIVQRRWGEGYVVQVLPAVRHSSIRLGVRLLAASVQATAIAMSELRSFVADVEVTVALAMEDALGQAVPVVSVLDAVEEGSATTSPTPETDDSWGRIAPVLAAVASGVGVLGFVTFVGGAIAWARFGGAGLPEEEALSIVPTSTLVVIGAATVVPAVVLALAAVALMFMVRVAIGTREERLGDEMGVGLSPQGRDLLRGISIGLFVFIFETVFFIATFEEWGWGQFGVFALVGGSLAVLTAFIAYTTPRFIVIGAAAFFALSVLLGGLGYARARDASDVRAAAVVRQNAKATIGFFIAETSSRVYLGRLETVRTKDGKPTDEIEEKGQRIIAIDKAQVSDIAIGPAEDPADALKRAQDLADELCGLQMPAAAKRSDAPSEQPPNCWHVPAGHQPPDS